MSALWHSYIALDSLKPTLCRYFSIYSPTKRIHPARRIGGCEQHLSTTWSLFQLDGHVQGAPPPHPLSVQDMQSVNPFVILLFYIMDRTTHKWWSHVCPPVSTTSLVHFIHMSSQLIVKWYNHIGHISGGLHKAWMPCLTQSTPLKISKYLMCLINLM